MSHRAANLWIAIGITLVAIPFLAMVLPMSLAGAAYTWSSAALLLALQWLVGGALLYAALEKRRGTELGDKLFPASVMSVVLWMAMLSFWWRSLL